jgi:hypothetical protein
VAAFSAAGALPQSVTRRIGTHRIINGTSAIGAWCKHFSQ